MSTGFHPLTIAEIRRETADAISIRFDVPDALKPVFAFKPGQHLTLRADLDGQDVRRNYSLCVAPQEGELRVAIKRVAGGLFSSFANQGLAPGMVMQVMAPHGAFTWAFDADASNHYVGFAGGSGITPVLSLLKSALLAEPNSRFTLLYGNRDSASIIFLEELAALKDRFMQRLSILHFLEDEEEEVALFNGRLDRAKCAELLERRVIPAADIAAFFICGPGPMMDAVEHSLLESGVARDKVLLERFTIDRPDAAQAAASAARAEAAAGAKVVLVLDGRRRSISFDPALGNILENARAAGLPAPYACKAGVCATCRAKLVSGTVEMGANYGLTAAEVAAGYILTCQSVPVGTDVVVDYDG
ncbi:2Fe-2S iron-sulfur cluster-binding protein [Niveispirillum sp. KHB5.9]|uniref:2Fe-2S iron-sulfur cluster-binding protein n=1 Tax=Niveispirillum sp. KHB5.9 TaxID=3400269 RepID=UPI003A8C8553